MEWHKCPQAHLLKSTFSELETFSNEACLLTKFSFLSLNHLPSSPHAKELIKLPQTCLFSPEIASLLVPPLSFFDIFVWMENNAFELLLWHFKKVLLVAQNSLSTTSITYKVFPQNEVEFVCTMPLFSLPWPSFHLSSPSPTQPHTLHSLRAISKQIPASLSQQRPDSCSLSITVHLAGCLFIPSAYSAKMCCLERFQPPNTRKQSEGGVWRRRHIIDTYYKSTIHIVPKSLVPVSLSSGTKIRKDDTPQHKSSPSDNQDADMLSRTIGTLPSRQSDVTFSSVLGFSEKVGNACIHLWGQCIKNSGK